MEGSYRNTRGDLEAWSQGLEGDLAVRFKKRMQFVIGNGLFDEDAEFFQDRLIRYLKKELPGDEWEVQPWEKIEKVLGDPQLTFDFQQNAFKPQRRFFEGYHPSVTLQEVEILKKYFLGRDNLVWEILASFSIQMNGQPIDFESFQKFIHRYFIESASRAKILLTLQSLRELAQVFLVTNNFGITLVYPERPGEAFSIPPQSGS